jgi:SAM-dependent methyltransferase
MHVQKFNVSPHNAHYDGTYADSELEWRRLGARDKVDNLQELLGQREISSVLEVGCGTGAVLAEVVRRGIGTSHIGIDMADPHEHMDKSAHNLDLRQYNGSRLPFEDNSFDLVFASHVLEHVPDPRGFLKEVSRVSRNLLYIEVPCEMNIRTSHHAIQNSLKIGHINGYNPEYFMMLLQTSGMDVVDMRVFDHSLPVHCFGRSAWKGYATQIIRKSMLRMKPSLATKLFCYHCGALIICP